MEEVERAGLLEQARTVGQRLTHGVRALGSPLVKDVRGYGLLLGIVLDTEAVEKAADLPEAGTPAMRVVQACLKNGLLVPPAGPDVVRLLPPLTLTEAEADEVLAILGRVLGAGADA
jgi:4-aminobutyrate aminotransferase-like enzyme